MIRYLLILTFIFCYSCKEVKPESSFKEDKNTKKIKSVFPNKQNDIYLSCLRKNDSLLIKKFDKSLKNAFDKNESNLIVDHVNIPFSSEGEMYTKEEFLVSFLDILKGYYFEEYIDSEEISDLKREIYYTSDKEIDNCFIYVISNDFPELEFNVRFYLGKVDGEIKIVKILMVG